MENFRQNDSTVQAVEAHHNFSRTIGDNAILAQTQEINPVTKAFNERAEQFGLKPQEIATGKSLISTIQQGDFNQLQNMMEIFKERPQDLYKPLMAVSAALAKEGISASYDVSGMGAGNGDQFKYFDKVGVLELQNRDVTLRVSTAGADFNHASTSEVDKSGNGKPMEKEAAFTNLQNSIAPKVESLW